MVQGTHSTLSDQLIAQLAEVVESRLGLRFPRDRWPELSRGVDAAARELGIDDIGSFLNQLAAASADSRVIQVLASHLTVGETYFFRDENHFRILGEEILPPLIRSKRETDRRLRIWSAACASGEEPYSIAILLTQLIPDIANWNITIIATDINPRSLRKASQGIYGEWSFRDAPPWLKQRYFRQNKQGLFELLPHIKKMVTFSYLNLAEDAYPALSSNTNAVDLIVCRNALMYLAPETAQKAIHNFHRSLTEGGWLLVAAAETSPILFSRFSTVEFPGAFFYRKSGCAAAEDRGVLHSFRFDFPPEHQIEPATSLPDDRQPPLPETPQPDNSDILRNEYEEALGLYNDGRYSIAADKLSSFLSGNGTDTKALSLLARVYANQGMLGEASACCERAIAADKLAPGLYYLRATILQEQNRAEEAVSSLKQALYLDPEFVLVHFALGNRALNQRVYKQAGKHFENALRLLVEYPPEEVLPESEGITAGRMAEIIRAAIAWSLRNE